MYLPKRGNTKQIPRGNTFECFVRLNVLTVLLARTAGKPQHTFPVLERHRWKVEGLKRTSDKRHFALRSFFLLEV